MTTKTRMPRKSIEEKRAQAEALHPSIAEQVDALRGTGQWQRFLDFAQSFHAYSLGNLLLILSQCPDATAVAGFRACPSTVRPLQGQACYPTTSSWSSTASRSRA